MGLTYYNYHHGKNQLTLVVAKTGDHPDLSLDILNRSSWGEDLNRCCQWSQQLLVSAPHVTVSVIFCHVQQQQQQQQER